MQPKNGVRFIKNVMIPTSDGVRLAIDMHVPDSDDWEQTPHPLILEYIPYRKDDTAPYSGYHNYFATLHSTGSLGRGWTVAAQAAARGLTRTNTRRVNSKMALRRSNGLRRSRGAAGRLRCLGHRMAGLLVYRSLHTVHRTSRPLFPCTSPTTAILTIVTIAAVPCAATTISVRMAVR